MVFFRFGLKDKNRSIFNWVYWVVGMAVYIFGGEI